MNVDAAFKDGKTAISGVMRNYWGEVLSAYRMMVDCVDSTHGEALAILTAILFCVEIDYPKITIEGDNESLILLVKGLVKGDNERPSTNATENIIKDIQKELSTHKFINVEHVFREENLLTHSIVDYVLSTRKKISYSKDSLKEELLESIRLAIYADEVQPGKSGFQYELSRFSVLPLGEVAKMMLISFEAVEYLLFMGLEMVPIRDVLKPN